MVWHRPVRALRGAVGCPYHDLWPAEGAASVDELVAHGTGTDMFERSPSAPDEIALTAALVRTVLLDAARGQDDERVPFVLRGDLGLGEVDEVSRW